MKHGKLKVLFGHLNKLFGTLMKLFGPLLYWPVLGVKDCGNPKLQLKQHRLYTGWYFKMNYLKQTAKSE